jgi:hypothetical protein
MFDARKIMEPDTTHHRDEQRERPLCGVMGAWCEANLPPTDDIGRWERHEERIKAGTAGVLTLLRHALEVLRLVVRVVRPVVRDAVVDLSHGIRHYRPVDSQPPGHLVAASTSAPNAPPRPDEPRPRASTVVAPAA